jgi:hypothetical protein
VTASHESPLPGMTASDPFGDLFGSATPASDVKESNHTGMMAVNQGGIEAQLFTESDFASSGDGKAVIRLVFTNNNPVAAEEFKFQAAVMKGYQIELLPPSGTRLEANALSTITQMGKIKKASSDAPALQMKVKLSYSLNGATQTIDRRVSAIPGL